VIHDLRFVGTHVRLEPLTPDHVAGLIAAATHNRETYGFTPVPDDEASMRRYVADALDNPIQMPFATCTPGGTVIGSTRFMALEWWDGPWRRTGGDGTALPNVAEIGSTWLAHGAQRSAVNTEAKLLMMAHAFEDWGVARMFLKTDELNQRSRAAIERLGARFEGVIRNHMPATGHPGLRNTAQYSIVPEEWPSVRDKLRARLV
jgi:N-acetyltransferase